MEEINEELDRDEDSGKGYYTRSKRRRLSVQCDQIQSGSQPYAKISEIRRRKNPIMFVPTEVLQNIFKYIPYHELSGRVRLVNRRFKVVAEDRLNLTFKNIEKTLDSFIRAVEISLACTQDDMEISCISKLLDMLEILKLQYTLIIATIWRYVYNEYYKTNRTCMYGGLIIDIFESFIRKFKHSPNQLYVPGILNSYAMPPEVTRIIQMAKQFCVYFDKINEESLPDSLMLSGCKVLDLLNCSRFAEKRLYCEETTDKTFFGKYSYYFKNSWFVAVPLIPSKRVDLPLKQRLMHMRLRRIVLAHNDMNLQQQQYQREILIRPNPLNPIRPPGNNLYTGFGDVEDTFFYYGVMNEGAYLQKFGLDDELDEDDLELILNDDQEEDNNLELVRVNSTENVLYSFPPLGFRVDVEVQCPLAYAPMTYLQNNCESTKKNLRRNDAKGETQIIMNFECYGVHRPRLPPRYHYKMRAKTN